MARILCIDDEDTIRMLIVEALSDVGHEVFEAADGSAGLQGVLQHAPDLVICDSLMPAMTGFELFQAIRERHPDLGTTPFVFLSAHADKSKIEDGLALGAAAYLTKPIDLDHLIDIVERTLDGRTRQISTTAGPGGPG